MDAGLKAYSLFLNETTLRTGFADPSVGMEGESQDLAFNGCPALSGTKCCPYGKISQNGKGACATFPGSFRECETMSGFRDLRVPHTYVLIFSIIVLCAILTHIIPAGEYDRYKNPSGQVVVNAESFHSVEARPAKFMDVFSAIPQGLKAQASLVFFVLIVGGAFQIMRGTGAIDSAITHLVRRLDGREFMIIPIFVTVFSLAGATMGTTNETLVFVPIGIMIARKVGYDTIVGTAMVTLGAAAGFNAGPVNPWNVGIAQGIAELPLYSGLLLRVMLQICFITILSLYLIRYARKVKADPKSSIVYGLEQESGVAELSFASEGASFGLRHALVLATFFASLGVAVHGVISKGWGINDMTPVFLAMGIISGVVGGLNPSRIASEFVTGAQNLLFGAMVIGIARGILVVLQNGMIMDTIVYSLAGFLQKLPSQFTLLGMLVSHIIINLFIPSGSGQAATTMPIMVPIADLTGVSRQCAVLAFQLGDGITNSCNPTSSNLNGYLSLSKITFPQWIKFVMPLICMWQVTGIIFLLVASAISW